MIINRNSWHYKLAFRLSDSRSHSGFSSKHSNLCSYFWSVALSLFTTIFISIISGFLLFSMVSSWILAFLGFFPWVIPSKLTGWDVISILGAGCTSIVLTAIAVSVVSFLFYLLCKFVVIIPQKGNSNLFMAWLKAKKEKACPLIEYREIEYSDE